MISVAADGTGAVPGLRRAPSAARRPISPAAPARRRFAANADYLVLHPGVSFAEQTKYLDEALHADARHEHVTPPLLSAKIRNDMLRSFLAPGPGDVVRRPGLRQRADARLERRPRRVPGRASTSARTSPARRATARTSCSATCAGCRSATASSRRPPRSTSSSTCRARPSATCCARPRACSRRAAGCSSTATCASNSRARRRPQADQPAGALARAPRPGRPGPRAPAQVRSPQPAGRHPRPRAHGRRGRLPHRAHPVLHAARRRLRREHPRARRRALAGEARGAARSGRRPRASTATTRRARRGPPPRRASAAGAPPYAGLRLVTWVMKLDIAALRPRAVGPLLRPARPGGRRERPPHENPLRRPRPARARAPPADRST